MADIFSSEPQHLSLLKMDARHLGMSPGDIGDILGKYGPVVLQLAMDALKDGFSLRFIIEALATLGPVFLSSALHSRKLARQEAAILKSVPDGQLTNFGSCASPAKTDIFGRKQPMEGFSPAHAKKYSPPAAAPFIIQGDDVGSNTDVGTVVTPNAAAIPLSGILMNVLIQLIQSEGPQLAQLLVDELVKLLQQNAKASNEKFTAAVAAALANQAR